MTTTQSKLWWERDDLKYQNGRLHLGTQDLQQFAHSAQTPTFAYRAPRFVDNLNRLHQALDKQHVQHKIFYAMKANRFDPLMTYARLMGKCGIDVCSPNELLKARQIGFQEEEIIYTGTSVSNQDLDIIARHPHVHVNCDAISTIRRLGERCPGRTIGIRINPQLTASYMSHLSYAGEKATKFGIYPDRFEEALEMAARYQLKVNTLHVHSGAGYLNQHLDQFEQILIKVNSYLETCPTIEKVDIGGGMGLPMVEGDEPLDLDRWATIVANFANPKFLEIHMEPGDYLVKDTAVLLVEVNSIEEKGGTQFVGVNAGFNIANLHAYYAYPFIISPVNYDPNTPIQKVTIAGNINEGLDTLAEDIELPQLKEGDYLAIMNLGGYSSANSSNHCMRGDYSQYLIIE